MIVVDSVFSTLGVVMVLRFFQILASAKWRKSTVSLD